MFRRLIAALKGRSSTVVSYAGFGRRRALPGEQMAGGEEGLAEVAGYDLFRVADGGEVDVGVPALE
jgi:hypothetical protein